MHSLFTSGQWKVLELAFLLLKPLNHVLSTGCSLCIGTICLFKVICKHHIISYRQYFRILCLIIKVLGALYYLINGILSGLVHLFSKSYTAEGLLTYVATNRDLTI